MAPKAGRGKAAAKKGGKCKKNPLALDDVPVVAVVDAEIDADGECPLTGRSKAIWEQKRAVKRLKK